MHEAHLYGEHFAAFDMTRVAFVFGFFRFGLELPRSGLGAPFGVGIEERQTRFHRIDRLLVPSTMLQK